MAAIVALTVSKPSCGLLQRHTSLHYEQTLQFTLCTQHSTQHKFLGLLQNKHNKPLGTYEIQNVFRA